MEWLIMYTIMLYVALCQSPSQCDSYTPASWSVTTQQETNEAFEQCAQIERGYMSVKGYKDSDCYIAEWLKFFSISSK